jgi:hypothetical protein
MKNENFFLKMNKFIYEYTLEKFYEELKEYTFKTEFLQLTIEESQVLYTSCKGYYSKGDFKYYFQKNDENVYNEIKNKINKIINNNFEKKAFIKLSTRSPKDSITDFKKNVEKNSINERMIKNFCQELKKYEKNDKNGHTIAFVNSTRKTMVIKNGEEAMEILYKSSRIREDLMKALDFPNEFNLFITIREWINIDSKDEFRCFVYNKKLTAVSQYCYYQYYENMIDKNKLKKLVTDFYDQVKEKIMIENYIMDICVNEDKVYLIELNPFFRDTSPCLFSWNKDDIGIIKNGSSSLEIRYLDKVVEYPYDCISNDWKLFIENYYKNNGSFIRKLLILLIFLFFFYIFFKNY